MDPTPSSSVLYSNVWMCAHIHTPLPAPPAHNLIVPSPKSLIKNKLHLLVSKQHSMEVGVWSLQHQCSKGRDRSSDNLINIFVTMGLRLEQQPVWRGISHFHKQTQLHYTYVPCSIHNNTTHHRITKQLTEHSGHHQSCLEWNQESRCCYISFRDHSFIHKLYLKKIFHHVLFCITTYVMLSYLVTFNGCMRW